MFKKINYILFALLASLGFSSCGLEQTIELDINQTETKLIIDALVTDETSWKPYVRLSQTADFYSTGKTPRVSGAEVIISDDLGNSYVLEEQIDEPGYYEASFVGEVGRTYSLKVTYNGQVYEASETMNRIAGIDSLTWEIDEEELNDPFEEDYYYDLLIFAKEPPETEDYYLFKFYRNDSIQNFDGGAVFYSDDDFLSENISGVEGPVFYKEGDVARCEMYSISRSGFIYFKDLDINVNNDGGMFGPIPANTSTNLSNGALGYFQVSAVALGSIVIGE